MALLNRATGAGPAYDEDGRLLGGLSALEELARVISIGNGENRAPEDVNGDAQEMVEAREFPVHTDSAISTDASSLTSESDSDLSDQSSDEALEEITVTELPDPPFPIRSSSRERSPLVMTSSPDAILLPPPENATLGVAESSCSSSSGDPTVRPSPYSRGGSEEASRTPVGDCLKQSFLDMNVVSTLLVSYPSTHSFVCLCYSRRNFSSSFPGITFFMALSMI